MYGTHERLCVSMILPGTGVKNPKIIGPIGAVTTCQEIGMVRWAVFSLAVFGSMMALPTSTSAADPKAIFARHDPQNRLPNTTIKQLGTVRVGDVIYSIYYLDFSNPVSLHGQQRIAVIRNGTQFAGAYECTLGPDDAQLTIGKARLTVRSFGMTFVIRFNEKGPSRNRYFCGEGSGWEDGI